MRYLTYESFSQPWIFVDRSIYAAVRSDYVIGLDYLSLYKLAKVSPSGMTAALA